MRITPLDVRKQEFRKAVRGFDCDEVRAFLTTLADEYETVLIDSKQIRDRLHDQEAKLAEYTKMERNLRDTLMTAERVMQETKESASRKGELMITDAQMKARNILEECRLRTEELRREIVNLRKEKENYLARFRALAESQIQFIDTHQTDFEDLDKRLIDLVDTVMVGNGEVEEQEAPAESPRPDAGTTVPRDVAGPDPEPVATGNSADNDDMWRDYNPGQAAESARSARAFSAQDPEPAAAPAATSAASPAAETPPSPRPPEPVETDLNHLLSETLTEIPADPAGQGDGSAFGEPEFVPAAVDPTPPPGPAPYPAPVPGGDPVAIARPEPVPAPAMTETGISPAAGNKPPVLEDPFAAAMTTSVEMASLGIPVPAIPVVPPTRDAGARPESPSAPLEVVNAFHT